VNDMERFNTCKIYGIRYIENLNKSTETMPIADFRMVENELTRLHTLTEQQGRELNRRDELIRKLDEERDYWELEAKRYCAELGGQKIKLQQLECVMCKFKDTSQCKEC